METFEELAFEADRGLQLIPALWVPSLLKLSKWRAGRGVVLLLAGCKKVPELLGAISPARTAPNDDREPVVTHGLGVPEAVGLIRSQGNLVDDAPPANLVGSPSLGPWKSSSC